MRRIKTEEAITLELEQPEAVEEKPEQESEESYEAEEKGIVSEQTLTDEKTNGIYRSISGNDCFW